MGWRRGLGLGAVAVVALTAVAGLALASGATPAARADEARTRCVRALRSKHAWRAKYVQTETGSDGKKSVARTEITVRRPGDYRVIVREQDDRGREVVSASIRNGDTLYTRHIQEDGTAVMHVMKGVRPTLGVEMDNALGETVQAVADATALRVVGSEKVRGRSAVKLELAPNRYVWADAGSGLPVREREVSGGATTHEVAFESFDAEPVVDDGDFSAASLGSVESTVVEDFGFRTVDAPAEAASILGFRPLTVGIPDGYSLAEQGFCDPSVSAGDREPEAAFVTMLTDGENTMLVTQVRRAGLGDTIYPVQAGEPDAPREIQVSGKRALIHTEETGGQLLLARRDILVTVEGNVGDDALIALGRAIR